MKEQYDVFGMGALAVDFIGSVDHWPEAGVKLDMSTFDIADGGLMGTALAAVARLGGKAGYVGKLN